MTTTAPPHNFDATNGYPFPRVYKIDIAYPENQKPRVFYEQCMAMVDKAGVVHHISGTEVRHELQLDALPHQVPWVSPDTGAEVPGQFATRGGLMMNLLAIVRADQKLRIAQASTPAAPTEPAGE
jgi:hypothetical protein